MTREEEIKLAAKKYSKCTTFAAEYDFTQGAEWADEHPKLSWIKVEDDLPCNHEELILFDIYTKQVMIADHEGCIGIQKMKKSCNGIIGVEPQWQWEIPSVVYYWMPIPELPKGKIKL